jgi:hypothetical protein
MDIVYACCAGFDVQKDTVVVTVRRRLDDGKVRHETRTYGTMTEQVLELGDWLEAEGVTHLAMESTGVYWKPVWNLPATAGLTPREPRDEQRSHSRRCRSGIPGRGSALQAPLLPTPWGAHQGDHRHGMRLVAIGHGLRRFPFPLPVGLARA